MDQFGQRSVDNAFRSVRTYAYLAEEESDNTFQNLIIKEIIAQMVYDFMNFNRDVFTNPGMFTESHFKTIIDKLIVRNFVIESESTHNDLLEFRAYEYSRLSL